MLNFRPIATGFCFLEAPRVDGRGLWFSENALGGVRRLRPNGVQDVFVPDRKPIGGIALNDDGKIIFSGRGGLSWLDPESGETGVLLDDLDGEKLAGCNDIHPDGRGGLYFGTLDFDLISLGESAGNSALYNLSPEKRLIKLDDNLKICNGIGLSPDGRRLYHNESMTGTMAYDLRPDGSAEPGRMISDARDCDGLAVDAMGGVLIAGTLSGTLTRILPDGQVDWRLLTPGGHPTSLAFGGEDLCDVYLTTAADGASRAVLKGETPSMRTAAIYHARSEIPGVPAGLTRFRI